METHVLNIIIHETVKLGEKLMFKEFTDFEFEKYKKLVNQITSNKMKISTDKIHIRTCELIWETSIEDFKFNFLKRLLAPYYITGEVFIARNTKKQIIKRYILSINSRLPILIN